MNGATQADVLARSRSTFRARVADYCALAKIRMNLLVVVATFSGAFLALREARELVVIVHAIVGTLFVSMAASALNQVIERDVDARMHRTRERPLPTGRMQPGEALLLGTALSTGGILYLAVAVNLLTAVLAALTVTSYVFAYTPLKRRSPLSTLVGAVPGALPALGGWTAVRGTLDAEGWILFAIVFFWQLPHFMAIATMHREDYARGGMPVLPVIDASGRVTGGQVVFHTLALLPVTLLPSVSGMTGPTYFFGACALGLAFLAVAVAFVRGPRDRWARPLFRASIAYLPALFILMMADKAGIV